MPDLTPITDAELTAFYTEQCITAPTGADEIKRLKALSFTFLCALPWCPDAEIDQAKFNLAQGYLINAMSDGFNPLVQQNEAQLKRRAIGRRAIEREWYDTPDELKGTSPIYLLRRLSVPYGLLKNWLCPELEESTVSGGIAICVV